MLELQKFIMANKDWAEKLAAAPYNLTIKEKGNLILFKYSQQNSDFSNQIVCEARGIILERNTWEVIRCAFFKFFNAGERHAATIDWASASAGEKIDGTLISLYFYDGGWNVATNSEIDAYQAPLNNGGYNSFGELFDVAAQNMGLDYTKLNPRYTYTFELVSKFNKVVISYPETKLYHLLTRDNSTLEEIEVNIGIPKPAQYYLGDEQDYLDLVNSMGEDHEGIVVKDQFNNRVKIKTKLYFELHHLVNNHALTLKRAIKLIYDNDTDELLAYFSEFTDYIEEVRAKIRAAARLMQNIQDEVETVKYTYQTRPEFAKWAKTQSNPSLYFLARDGKLFTSFNPMPDDSEEIIQRKIAKLIETFKLEN